MTVIFVFSHSTEAPSQPWVGENVPSEPMDPLSYQNR